MKSSEWSEIALRIGRRICRDAIWEHGRCTWLTWAMDLRAGPWRAVVCPLPDSLYEGVAGVAWFLGELAVASGDPVVRRTAIGALRQLAQMHQETTDGLYVGRAGVSLTLLRIGRLLDQDELHRIGLERLEALAMESATNFGCDVLTGAAGIIQALLLAQAELGEIATDAALRCGDLLVRKTVPAGQGVGWHVHEPPQFPPLAGYAHGASGVVTALAQVRRATGVDRFDDVCRQGLAYESTLFDSATSGWRDLRTPAEDQDAATFEVEETLGWCNGSPGIGLARLSLFKNCAAVEEPALRSDIEHAVASTLPYFERERANHSLCHGVCGNLEFLWEAGRTLGRVEWGARAEEIAEQSARSTELDDMPWRCGLAIPGETPSLMLGTAGIGLFYLRMADPSIPSILTLADPPCQLRSSGCPPPAGIRPASAGP